MLEVSLPLKWHGGKKYLASHIISMMPVHTVYVECFFGGGAVLFRKSSEGVSEVVNDVNHQLINFWKVLSTERLFNQFQRIIHCVPFSKYYWEQRNDIIFSDIPEIDNAVRFFIKYRQSRQGLGKDYATPVRSRVRRNMNENVSAWLSAVEGLPQAHERLKKVEIYCEDFSKVIRYWDGKDTLFYLDPTYMPETRVSKDAYEYEMKTSDHVRMLEQLSGIKGKFILSGYTSRLYANYEKENGWKRVDIAIDNKASSATIKEVKIESLWYNY